MEQGRDPTAPSLPAGEGGPVGNVRTLLGPLNPATGRMRQRERDLNPLTPHAIATALQNPHHYLLRLTDMLARINAEIEANTARSQASTNREENDLLGVRLRAKSTQLEEIITRINNIINS